MVWAEEVGTDLDEWMVYSLEMGVLKLEDVVLRWQAAEVGDAGSHFAVSYVHRFYFLG